MIGIIANIALLACWLWLVYLIKRKSAVMIQGFLTGIFCVWLLTVLVRMSLIVIGITLTEQTSKIIVAPLLEETLKFLFILLPAWKSPGVLKEVKIFGITLGLGFAFMENFGASGDVWNIVFRGVITWAMHIVTTLILAHGAERVLKSSWSMVRVIFSLMASVAVHGAFNYVVLCLGYG